MKKVMLLIVGAALLLSSCGTYTGSGAYVGSSVGAVLGSAIGGISGGGRGADLGTIVGMAGGAAVGAAIGQAADQRQAQREKQDIHDHYMRVQQNKARGINPYASQGSANKASQVTEVSVDDMYNVTPSSKQPTVVVDETGSADDRAAF